MQVQLNYHLERKLKSLSKHFKYLTHNNNAYTTHSNTKIKSENLQSNLSLIISHIILNLKFIDRSKGVFLKIIKEYNQENSTDIEFKDFESIFWIRTVRDEITIPGLVQNFIFQIGYKEKEGKPVDIPNDKKDLLLCLQIYYQSCFENANLTIEKEILETVLTEFASKEVTIDFLVEKGIIGFDSQQKKYYWIGNEYAKHLRNEIASTLWLLIIGKNASELDFKKFFKLIEGTQIWVDNLGDYLSNENTSKICEFAVSFLNKETDLIKSDNEFTKIWLDSSSSHQISIREKIPNIEFNYDSTFDFIESVNYWEERIHDIFYYQRTRSYCYSLIRLVVHNDPEYPIPYQNVINILKDTSRPFLAWTLYEEIPKLFPQVIPYLLTNSELIPIAFQQIDNIEIDNTLLSEQSNNDRTFEESCELKNQLWIEMFDATIEQLVSLNPQYKEGGKHLAKVLADIAEKVFKFNSNNKNSIISHDFLIKRYDYALNVLSSKRISNRLTYADLLISPRLIFLILPEIFDYLKKRIIVKRPNRNEFSFLSSGIFDLCIEIIRLANLNVTDKEISIEQKDKLTIVSDNMITLLKDHICQFYSSIEIIVQPYASVGVKKKKVKRGIGEFGFEIIDWGYLYLHFQKQGFIKDIDASFKSAIDFNTKSDKYDDQNREQLEKIKLYLKSIMLAYISINDKKDLFEVEGLPVKDSLKKIEGLIKDLALTHSVDRLHEMQIDVFDDRFSLYGYNMYYQSLISLLFKSINHFKKGKQNSFIIDFFNKSVDIGRMLTALNILESKEHRVIISKQVENIDVKEFMQSRFTITEILYASIEAVNSEDHWALAKPLIGRIQSHIKRKKYQDNKTENILYELNLILAFKEKDNDKLSTIPIPQNDTINSSINPNGKNLQRFFIALYELEYSKEYDKVIVTLQSLLSSDVKNVRYAFYIYRAKSLKAIENGIDKVLLKQANHDWDNFTSNLSDKERKGLSSLTETICSNNLYYFAAINDSIRFDQSIKRLSKRYLYDDETIPIIYNFYTERGLHELAFDYITKASIYLLESGIFIPDSIQDLIFNSESSHLLSNLKLCLSHIRVLSPKKLPLITPEIINDKRNLNEFILGEIVQASKVLLDKIQGVKKNPHENRYNDLLLAALRLRFQIWGWSIHDQPRIGNSPTGKDAGEIDIIIQAGNNPIALLEALILTGKNKSLTQNHILKSFSYIKYLERYYMIVYYKGAVTKFDKTWDSYKSDVASVCYPEKLSMSKAKGFEDLSRKFDDVRHLKIAKSTHGTGVEMFHIMINLV